MEENEPVHLHASSLATSTALFFFSYASGSELSYLFNATSSCCSRSRRD